MSSTSYYGNNLDRYIEHNDQSTLHKMKETYWTTKQAVIKKLGKKEDEHVVASDQELDSKLEIFRAIQKSSMELLRVIEKYQDRICALSQEENAAGRFLKSQSSVDKTRAGKMMAAVGKSQSFAAQQRLALRVPLVRLYQEVETFRYRAISDTLMTINRMEGARTEYRGALLWMKAVSEELDPDTYKQLEKFRKVQAQVRKTKARFDKLKLDVMQKIDLLAASRCNMFSHVLANYQSTLLHFWEKTSRTMTAVSESFKGYQFYEFSMLKELTETSKKLCKETKKSCEQPERDTDTNEESQPQKSVESSLRELLGDLSDWEDPSDNKSNRLLSLDDDDDGQNKRDTEKNSSLQNLYESDTEKESHKTNLENPFIDFEEDDTKNIEDLTSQELDKINAQKLEKSGKKDPLTDNLDDNEADKDDISLLNEILNAPSTEEDEFSREWQAVFGPNSLSSTLSFTPVESDQPNNVAGFMPSSLLDRSSDIDKLTLTEADSKITQELSRLNSEEINSSLLSTNQAPSSTPSSSVLQQAQSNSQPKQNKTKTKMDKKPDMSAWFSLFADLDPLANPDAIGKKGDELADA
ncbi:islet cell autoantigen 1 isoform X4 [Octopus bimaculoides]|uniref:AH domain-containing protein n=1 Tax=Octopus bimaculoides TaxID=37653 RepID=A0A0L8I3V6_OCTBM|nr:islet cell autoantigen 1 isoform X4 [Octopus bimaculoides]|eukprot:XP_014791349.1 PREDICTED: islet cell autoantigen 1-like isoform X4 [Octopus bimaculoides]